MRATKKGFDSICDYQSSNLVRQISYCTVDDIKDIQEGQLVCSGFVCLTKETIDLFDDNTKTISHKEGESICNKYISLSKTSNNSKGIEFFFTLYEHYPKNYVQYTKYFKSATKKEIRQARKDFGHIKETCQDKVIKEHKHTFSDNAKVLEYRGLRMIIDNEGGDAGIKDEKGEVHNFQLIGDGYYPIDQYIVYHIV